MYKIKQALSKAIDRMLEGEREEIDTDDRSWVHGSIQQRVRLVWAADYCCARFPGDIVEIGCLHGGTTKLLAPIAKRYDRRVICVDPWIHLPYYGPRDPYEIFCEVMQPWWDVLDIVKMSSLDLSAIRYVQERPLAFAFVDGEHGYEACRSDIETVAHCAGLVAVDDVLWSIELMQAFKDGAHLVGREAIHNELCREGWLLPK